MGSGSPLVLSISFPFDFESPLMLGTALFCSPRSPNALCHSCLRSPLWSPHFQDPALQQTLVGALLVGLVGDIGQVDTTEGWAVVQHDITHAETQDISLQTLLQVLQEPRRLEGGGELRGRRVVRVPV